MFVFRPKMLAQSFGALLPEKNPCSDGYDDDYRDDQNQGCCRH
jgi:hypothetical protein